ncbi:MAG: DNA-3-methyladenine glycosylase 2 family protein [Gammaproteobacteria bacterium]|nr:MAG: DNA-3-methyladenine glycosylase 2 family protein [Gammaproteobacteria bacterium]
MNQETLAHLSSADAVLGGLIRAVGPYKLATPQDCHPFQVLAQAIAHQQLNGTAANTILKRLVDSCGQGKFPTPHQVLEASVERLRAAGFSFAKVAALKDLAAKTLAAVVPDGAALRHLSDEDIIARLTQVRGIGRWTVEMLLMFQLGRPDVLPVDDFGVRAGFRAAYGLRGMPHPRALAAWGERWKPFRTTAAWYLWRALELKRAGTLPAPAERIRLPRVKRLRRAARRGPAKARRGKPRARAAVRARKVRARRASPAGARAPRSAPPGRLRKAKKTG